MPRKSIDEIRIHRIITDLELWLADPDLGDTARSKYMGTPNSLNRQQAKRKADKASAAAARRAERDETERTATLPRLPDNGRLALWHEREAERR
jgi:hypothetical protein